MNRFCFFFRFGAEIHRTTRVKERRRPKQIGLFKCIVYSCLVIKLNPLKPDLSLYNVQPKSFQYFVYNII